MYTYEEIVVVFFGGWVCMCVHTFWLKKFNSDYNFLDRVINPLNFSLYQQCQFNGLLGKYWGGVGVSNFLSADSCKCDVYFQNIESMHHIKISSLTSAFQYHFV